MTQSTELIMSKPAALIGTVRVQTGVIMVAMALCVLAVIGAFVDGSAGSVSYVASLWVAALVVLFVAKEHPVQARQWRLAGVGLTTWALAGFLVTLQSDAGLTAIPDVVVSLLYVLGYVPLLVGLAGLCDPERPSRLFTNLVDGILLFLVLYAVLWLAVVERVTVDGSLSRLDRAFSALYPAGDVAVLMLAFRVVSSHVGRRSVGVLLLVGAVLTAVADVALLVLYLRDPGGTYPITDLAYLLGITAIALAAMLSLLPSPPAVAPGASLPRRLAMTVAVSSLMPPIVLLTIVQFTGRRVSLTPVAVWILLAVGAAVLRHVSSVRELERVHQQSEWQVCHDPVTGLLSKAAFEQVVSQGSPRERSGTVLVVEALRLSELRDESGYDVVDEVMVGLAAALRNVAGDSAVLARYGHDHLVAFVRSTDPSTGRQLAVALQRHYSQGVDRRSGRLPLVAIVGVAQADGTVIDVVAGVRRATEAARLGRVRGAGFIAIDADLTGISVALRGAAHPSRRDPVVASSH